MSNTIIKPTVGRVVWFYPSKVTGQAGFAHASGDEPLAAIIAKVWNDKLVNLAVFDANGVCHSRTSVMLVQDGDPIPGGGYYATWMPYQVGQAKKQADEATAGEQPKASCDAVIEAEIKATGLTAPRVKQEDLTANIANTEFVTHVSKSGQVLRWAILTTQSGFAVTGNPSVAVSPENDNEQIGHQVAYDNARNELWPLMGYALKERLHAAAQSTNETITFDAFVQYGRDNGANIVNGMPWSFSYKDNPVTHENDQRYIVGIYPHQVNFTPDHVLIIGADGKPSLKPAT